MNATFSLLCAATVSVGVFVFDSSPAIESATPRCPDCARSPDGDPIINWAPALPACVVITASTSGGDDGTCNVPNCTQETCYWDGHITVKNNGCAGPLSVEIFANSIKVKDCDTVNNSETCQWAYSGRTSDGEGGSHLITVCDNQGPHITPVQIVVVLLGITYTGTADFSCADCP